MDSVKKFAADEPALFKATQDFVRLFASVEDPVLAVAARAKDANAQIAWALLGTALFQDRTGAEISALLSALYAEYPDEKLWVLPVPTAPAINAVVERTFGSKNWSLFEHVAGIFWSVGLFVRHHPDLVAWAAERTPAEIWRDLGEIYFMGKKSVRPKACAAIYRIVMPAPLGLSVACKRGAKGSRSSTALPPLPLTMGMRRFLAILGPARDDDFSGMEPERKQKLAENYCAALCPENPYVAAHALQFFLETGIEDFACREQTHFCAKCPLYEHCGYAARQG